MHHFIDSSRYLESLSSSITLYTSYDLAVVFVSIVSIHSLQHVMGNEQKNLSSTSDIIYWDKQHQMSYRSSCLFMYFFTHGDSSIASQNICFSTPIGLCMTEPERFHYYTFVNVVEIAMCLEKIEYQPWHLSNTLISRYKEEGFLGYNEGINEVLEANNQGQ